MRVAVLITTGIVLALSTCGPPTETVTIAGVTVEAELADTSEKQQKGLSGRVDLLGGEGMVFDLGEPKQTEVWMRNVLIPLDVVWIRDNEVLRIDTLNPCVSDPCPGTPSPGAVDTILEAPAGTFADTDPGSKVSRS